MEATCPQGRRVTQAGCRALGKQAADNLVLGKQRSAGAHQISKVHFQTATHSQGSATKSPPVPQALSLTWRLCRSLRLPSHRQGRQGGPAKHPGTAGCMDGASGFGTQVRVHTRMLLCIVVWFLVWFRCPQGLLAAGGSAPLQTG